MPDDSLLASRQASAYRSAIVALIVGIVSIPFCGVLLGPLGVYLGFRSRRLVAETGARGGGLATAAIVTGAVGFVLAAVILVVTLTDPDFFEGLDNARRAVAP